MKAEMGIFQESCGKGKNNQSFPVPEVLLHGLLLLVHIKQKSKPFWLKTACTGFTKPATDRMLSTGAGRIQKVSPGLNEGTKASLVHRGQAVPKWLHKFPNKSFLKFHEKKAVLRNELSKKFFSRAS